MAWRTTATFSGRAGRVNSTSGIVRAVVSCRTVPQTAIERSKGHGGGAEGPTHPAPWGGGREASERPAAVGEVIASAPGRDPAHAVHDALRQGSVPAWSACPGDGP